MKKKYIGADVGGTSVKIGIVTEDGEILDKSNSEYANEPVDQSVMQTIIKKIYEICGQSGTDMKEISGIGVSAAGNINSAGGCVMKNPGNVRGWANTKVCSILENEFGIRATIANDANCAVMGEYWAGSANGYDDVVGVTLGTGVGGGIITGGKLLSGSRGYAGEIGHFPTHAGGRECSCGLRGCYERYAAVSALIKESSSADPEWKNGLAFFNAVAAGDRTASGILDKWLDEVAYGIAGLIHLFDPGLVLIGGGVSKQEELLVRPLEKKVRSMIMPDYAEDLEFRAARLGNDAGMIGAVYYFVTEREGD